MTLIGFLVLLLIAAICGSIGQALAGYDLGGCLVSIVVGFIGAYIGLWIAGKFNLPQIFTITIEGAAFSHCLGGYRICNFYIYSCTIAKSIYRTPLMQCENYS